MDTLRSRLRGIYHALTKKAIPLRRGEQSRPFFIVGSGRCGTTLLRRILQASEEIHIPPENWSLAYSIHHFDQNRWHLGWKQLTDIVVSAHAHRSYKWFEEPPISLIEEVEEWPEERRSLYRLIDRIYRYHGEANDAIFDRWGDKTPINIQNMNSIIDVFKDSFFIHLIRDGLDVVHSYTNRFDYSGDISKPSRRWNSAMKQARKFKKSNPKSIIEMRYENLVKRPEKEVKKLCNFIGVKYSGKMLTNKEPIRKIENIDEKPHYKNVKKDISTKGIGKGRRNMSEDKKREVADIIQKEMIRMGYEPIDV